MLAAGVALLLDAFAGAPAVSEDGLHARAILSIAAKSELGAIAVRLTNRA